VNVTVRQPECGNGYLEPPEECDDGNKLDGDDSAPDAVADAVAQFNSGPSGTVQVSLSDTGTTFD
jgi:cysteine-rich repeat protein